MPAHREPGEQVLRVPPVGRCRARSPRGAPADGTRSRRRSVALRHTLTVPCQPIGASPTPNGRAGPGARRSAATTGGTARQNVSARRGAAGPGSAPAPARRAAAARAPNGSAPDQVPRLASGRRSIRAAAAADPPPRSGPTRVPSKPAAAAGSSHDHQRRVAGQVGVGRAEAGTRTGPEQLREADARQCPQPAPVDGHPDQGRAAARRRGTRQTCSVTWVMIPSLRERSPRRPTGCPTPRRVRVPPEVDPRSSAAPSPGPGPAA